MHTFLFKQHNLNIIQKQHDLNNTTIQERGNAQWCILIEINDARFVYSEYKYF